MLDPKQITGIRMSFDELPLGDHGLATTFLQLPMTCRIGDIELIAYDDGAPYGRPAIMGFARFGLVALESAQVQGRSVYEVLDSPAAFLFEMDGDDNVIVHSTWRCRTARVAWDELHSAWMQFADWLRRELPAAYVGIDRYPTLNWNRWFAGHFHEEPEPVIGNDYDEHSDCLRQAGKQWRK